MSRDLFIHGFLHAVGCCGKIRQYKYQVFLTFVGQDWALPPKEVLWNTKRKLFSAPRSPADGSPWATIWVLCATGWHCRTIICHLLRRRRARHHRSPGPSCPAPPVPGTVCPVHRLWSRPGEEHHLHPVSCAPACRAGLGAELLHHVRRAEPYDPV